MTQFYKLFNGGCGCAKCEADDAQSADAQSADTKIVNDYDTKIVNDYEGDDDEEVENTGYRSAMSAMRNSRLATLSESVFGTEDDPNSLEGLAEVGKKIKEKKIHQGPGAVASFLNVEGEDEELENRGVAALFNSQPCGDSHIPDGYQCHSGQAHELSDSDRKHLSVRTWNPETRKSDWQYWSSGAENWLSAPTDEHGVPTPEFIRQALKLPLLSSEIKSERHRAMDDGEPYTQGYRVDTYAKGTRVPAGLQSHESREDNDGVKIMYPRTIKKLANSSVTALFNSQPCGDSHIPDGHQCHAGQGAATHEESSKPIGHIKDALIIGDGAKYVEFNGQLVPFVSRSATDRMRSGERYTVVISESYHPKYGKTLSADRPVGRLANSQPCGGSHIPDGYKCHVGGGASVESVAANAASNKLDSGTALSGKSFVDAHNEAARLHNLAGSKLRSSGNYNEASKHEIEGLRHERVALRDVAAHPSPKNHAELASHVAYRQFEKDFLNKGEGQPNGVESVDFNAESKGGKWSIVPIVKMDRDMRHPDEVAGYENGTNEKFIKEYNAAWRFAREADRVAKEIESKFGLRPLLSNRQVELSNSQPCGDSHIPDGAQCHVGQGAAPASRDTADRQSNERSLSQKHEERYIASTILDQIKATDRAALMAWGTRNPTIMPAGKVGEDGYQRGGVQFKVNGGKLGHGIVKVRLMANDTYMVETGKVRTGQWKPQGKRDGVYADSLMETIDHMIERDRPGYANRYHTALEAMVNAGTSEGVRKSWETRRGGGVQHPQEDERGMDKAFVASSKAWDGARESEQRGDFAAASAHHRAAQSAHEAAYKIERATGGTTDGTYQIEAEKHKGIADKYDKQARDIAPVAALPTASPGPSAVQVGTAEDRAAMDARVRSPQFRKMMERRRKAGARWQLTHE